MVSDEQTITYYWPCFNTMQTLYMCTALNVAILLYPFISFSRNVVLYILVRYSEIWRFKNAYKASSIRLQFT